MSNQQIPLGTNWGPAATAEQVAENIDMTGKLVVVTGGASGLGLETTRVLSSLGAQVVVPVRRVAEAEEALEGISRTEVYELDLVDRGSVRRFASEFLQSSRSIDRLILNAGVMATPLFRDNEGNEGQFATNHLGHFALTVALWPALLQAKDGARVVALSSRGHHICGIDPEDPNFLQRPYDKWQAYGQSKTANSLFAAAVDTRGRKNGIRAYSVHPGSVVGPLARHLSSEEINSFGALDENGSPVIDPKSDKKNFAQGAATSVWCATSPSLNDIGGVYCENSDVASLEETARKGVRPYAVDLEEAEKLWKLSVDLTGANIK